MYLIGEGIGGLLQYDMQGNAKKLNTNTGFYTFVSKSKKIFIFLQQTNLVYGKHLQKV